MGAEFLGVNLWPGSKRYLPLERASSWIAEIPATTRVIGVFVNPDPAYLKEAALSGLLSHVQLHGDESPDFCAAVMDQGVEVIKAIQVRDAQSLEAIADYPVKHILLDAYHPQERGGIGETFPWTLAQDFQAKYPERTLWLAGGLTAENVAQAVQGVHPYAVDVASGVEAGTPGVKDLDKVQSFIQRAREG